MYQFTSEANFIIQGLIFIVMIGVFYNLIVTTRAYGGIVGHAVRLVGIGIVFFSITTIERSLVNFSIIKPTLNASLAQDVLSILGLIFSGLGFSKLASSTKS
jgi:hypothetical protein